MSLRLVFGLFVALLAHPVSAEVPLGRAGGDCLRSDHAVEAVREGRARPLAEIRRGLEGDLLRAELCRSHDGLVYSITVLDRNGRVRRLEVDAVKGGIRYDGR